MKSESYVLFLITVTLVVIGIVVTYSAGAVVALKTFNDGYFFLKREVLYAGLGLCLLLAATNVDYHHWVKFSKVFLIFCAALLLLVLHPSIGRKVDGARRWLALGPLTFQPSELARLAAVCYLAAFCAERQDRIRSLVYGFLPPMLIVGLIAFLILLEPDLGTPVTLFIVAMAVLFVAGVKFRYVVSTVLLGLPVIAALILMEPYRVRRILIYKDPWKDPLGDGWQMIQSLVAFGSGGITGVGWGKSIQRLLYLPASHTDFVFSILGEEGGLIATLTVVGLFAAFACLGFRVAFRAPDLQGTYLAVGLTLMVVISAAVNMSVAVGVIPTKGIPLPFISFGGSSLVVNMLAMGILMSVCGEVVTSKSSWGSGRRSGGRVR